MAYHKKLDITGERIGSLVAESRSHCNPSGQWVWVWRCDCGKTYQGIPASMRYRFRRDGQYACGRCDITTGRKAADLTGRTIGDWTVLHRLPARTAGRNIMYQCQCKCGTEQPVRAKHLTARRSLCCLACAKKRHWGERVAMRRLKLGLTVEECAARYGCTKQNWSAIEHQAKPHRTTRERVEQLLLALEVSEARNNVSR